MPLLRVEGVELDCQSVAYHEHYDYLLLPRLSCTPTAYGAYSHYLCWIAKCSLFVISAFAALVTSAFDVFAISASASPLFVISASASLFAISA